DEIVLLDSGSSDETETIARRYTDKVFVASDWPGYGPQRQRAQSHASGDWIFMLDA
ncbi:MAG: glycosyltransferase, partial [Anaerolineae bacterium]|nr:glycosyltransferase [Anaerolineae bacterium]